MKVIIIEDEKLSADYLKNILKKVDDTIDIIAVFESVEESVIAFNNGMNADIIFSDIHLSDGLSFDIFSKINIKTPIIFTTAYDEFAIQAFKLNSIDYLLKPIGIYEMKAAIEKYKDLKYTKESKAVNLIDLSELYQIESIQIKNRFIVKMGDTISSIKTDQISFFLAEDGVVLLVNNVGKKYIIDYTIDQLDSCLDKQEFFRINRKVIISLNAIQKVSSYFNSRLKVSITNLEEEIGIVSRERVGDFKKWLDGVL